MKTGIRIIPFNPKMREARKQLGYTQKDIADIIGIPQATISAVERWHVTARETMEDIACLLNLSIHDLIPEGVSRQELKRLKSFELIVDVQSLEEIEAPAVVGLLENKVNSEELARVLREQLAQLHPRQRKVLELRYGLNDGKQYTMEETAQLFGVTRERIRQVEAVALRKLRHPRYSRKLRAYLDSHERRD